MEIPEHIAPPNPESLDVSIYTVISLRVASYRSKPIWTRFSAHPLRSTSWYDLFSEVTITDAILDRLNHTSHRFELKGESLRKKLYFCKTSFFVNQHQGWVNITEISNSSSVEIKLVQDIDKILNEEQPKFEWVVDYSPEFIRNQGYFGTSRSFIKAILCLFAMHKPKSFDNHLDVNIDNSWFKIATSKN